AHKKGWFDKPDYRKIHTVATPRLGGIGIVVSFIVSVLFVMIVRPQFRAQIAHLWPLGIVFIVIHILGVLDDFLNLRALYRFVIQVGLALFVIAMDFRFKQVWLPGQGAVSLGWLSYPLTMVWIIGAINALNMIDGMDGLSGGISFIAFQAYTLIFLTQGSLGNTFIAFTLAGSVLAFLFFNMPTARIFMGDGGSTALGFALAVLPLMPAGWPDTGFRMWDAGTLILIPIYDVVASMLRRIKQKVPIMHPDKWHLHHKLLHLGFNVRTILALVYALSVYLSLSVGVGMHLTDVGHWYTLLISWFVLLVFFLILHYWKERTLNRAQALKTQ
ncbi:MAG TPA: MraY family glycosyltransferase, partial [Spirochaetales bacterium]|nr:MraY family glycosyltransferase [Spirochaetales bacterium]